MVVEYSDIYDSVKEQIPEQDWTDRTWTTRVDGASVEVFRTAWGNEAGEGIYYYSYGQGDDPEQEPIILELVLGDAVENREQKKDELRDRLEGRMKDLIGWEETDDDRVFMRKELPSDPLTLLPRLLEEFKKLEVVSNQINDVLGETAGNPG